jgi:hypothetical protein
MRGSHSSRVQHWSKVLKSSVDALMIQVNKENEALARSLQEKDDIDSLDSQMVKIRMATNNRMAIMTMEDVNCLLEHTIQ